MKKILKVIEKISSSKVVLCDVGARGGLPSEWVRIGDYISVVAFEPDVTSAQMLEINIRKKCDEVHVFNEAVWSNGSVKEFHETKSAACSSLLCPNEKFLCNFTLCEKFEVINASEINVTTIDAVFEDKSIDVDFMKIDVQGGTLDVLRGANKSLETVIGLSLEAEFAPMYQGEKLFGEIDSYVRDMGFLLIDLRPTYWRRSASRNIPGSKGELVYADLLYLLSPEMLHEKLKAMDESSRIEYLSRAIICCAAYGLNDWIVNYIEYTKELIAGTALFVEVTKLASSGKFIARLPDFKYRHFIGNVLKDIADQLHAPKNKVILQDQGIAGLKRHFWIKKR